MVRIKDDSSRPDLSHNVLVNVGDATLWLLGISFVSTTTILPVYVSHLTTSALVIGLIPALESLGWYLPQLFTAPFVEGRSRIKPLVLLCTFFERIPFLLIGIVIFALPPSDQRGASLSLLLFFALFALRVFASGLTAIPWQELMARVISTRHRGRFFAAQRMFGGIAGLLGAVAAGGILARFEYPLNFALCFFCCSISVTVSFGFLSLTREKRQPSTRTGQRLTGYLKELPVILRGDKNFLMYLIGRAIALLGGMATAFLAVHAVQSFGLDDSEAAIFTGILLAANIVFSVGWGWIGDKRGQKRVLALSLAVYALGMAVAWWSDSLISYYVVFALVGAANAGLLISDLALVLEFAPSGRRPSYMGIARGLLSPWIGLAPVIGAVLLGSLGYERMIVISGILTLMGLFLVSRRVQEPRSLKDAIARPIESPT